MKTNSSRGFMLIEVVVFSAIVALSVVAFTAVAQKSIYLSRQALRGAQAAFLLEEGAEVARLVRDEDWENIAGLDAETDYYPLFADNAWTLSVSPSVVGIFTRKVNTESVNRDPSNDDIAETGTPDPGTRGRQSYQRHCRFILWTFLYDQH